MPTTKTKATRTRKARPAAAATQANPAGTTRPRANPDLMASRRQEILDRVVQGDETIGAVAKDLGIQTGKAAFIRMQLLVEQGTVPKINFKNDTELVTRTVAARNKADAISAWGWLAARTGLSEGTLKQKIADADPSVLGTNVASTRKAARPPKATKRSTAKTKAAGRPRTRTRGTRNPS